MDTGPDQRGDQLPATGQGRFELSSLYDQITLEDLPGSMYLVAGIVGLQATIELMKRYGGLEVYIPRAPEKLPPSHWLIQMMGEEGTTRLCQYFKGDMLKVPIGKPALGAARKRVLRQRYARGEAAPALAREFGMSKREVERAVSGVRRGFLPQGGEGPSPGADTMLKSSE